MNPEPTDTLLTPAERDQHDYPEGHGTLPCPFGLWHEATPVIIHGGCGTGMVNSPNFAELLAKGLAAKAARDALPHEIVPIGPPSNRHWCNTHQTFADREGTEPR